MNRRQLLCLGLAAVTTTFAGVAGATDGHGPPEAARTPAPHASDEALRKFTLDPKGDWQASKETFALRM